MKAPLYVTSLEQTGGKTLVTLGLVSELSRTFDRVGFIKPLGVARVRAGRDGIDLDALLIDKLHAVHENIKDMCPVTLGPTSWPEVTSEESERMMARIQEAFSRISQGRQVVVVEGTGGASLGAYLGLSNARIAKALGCKVLLVVSYGEMASNPFDKVLIHRDHFKMHGVESLGVVINRVPPDLLDSFQVYATSQLERLNLPLLGLMPEEPLLKCFRFLQVSEVLDGEILCNAANAERVISRVRVGAMTPHRALPFFVAGTLIITPGDREDIIVTVCAAAASTGRGPSGLVLSAGQRPHSSIIELLEKSGVPTFLAREDSYTVASKIHDMPMRIQPTDEAKLAIVQRLAVDHLQIDRIIELL
ncbi:MAG: phosphotransacetylase family protein [Planctomycetota bacterium]